MFKRTVTEEEFVNPDNSLEKLTRISFDDGEVYVRLANHKESQPEWNKKDFTAFAKEVMRLFGEKETLNATDAKVVDGPLQTVDTYVVEIPRDTYFDVIRTANAVLARQAYPQDIDVTNLVKLVLSFMTAP